MEPINELQKFGAAFRRQRQIMHLTQQDIAVRAGCRRQTVGDLEAGENVGLEVALAALAAIGKGLQFVDLHPETVSGREQGKSAETNEVPTIPIAEYPQLKMICWNLRRDIKLTPADALARYERNWRFIDEATLTANEARLINRLKKTVGHGVLNV